MDMPEYSYWIIAGLALMIAEFAVSGLVVIFFRYRGSAGG